MKPLIKTNGNSYGNNN